jgi:hypothetical protein
MNKPFSDSNQTNYLSNKSNNLDDSNKSNELDVSKSNIEMAFKRGGDLEDLTEKSKDLAIHSKKYENESRKLKRKMIIRDAKRFVITVIVVLIIMGLIGLFIYAMTKT